MRQARVNSENELIRYIRRASKIVVLSDFKYQEIWVDNLLGIGKEIINEGLLNKLELWLILYIYLISEYLLLKLKYLPLKLRYSKCTDKPCIIWIFLKTWNFK